MPRRGRQNDMDLVDAVCKALHLDEDMREQFHEYLHDHNVEPTQGMKFQELFQIGVEFKNAYYSELREQRQREREEQRAERQAEYEANRESRRAKGKKWHNLGDWNW